MATISREPIALLTDKVLVKLNKEDYLPKFEKALKGYAKNANVPGFRKGHVPAGMVKKMYGQALFQEEVLREAGDALSEYLRNEKVEILGQPMIMPEASARVLDMSKTDDLEFAFEIGLKPDFKVPAISGDKTLTSYKVKITDGMVNDEADRIAKRYGKVEHPETITHPEHLIYAEYLPCDATGVAQEEAEPIKETTEVKSLPVKLQEMVMGKSAGEKILFSPLEVCSADELVTFATKTLKLNPAQLSEHYELNITQTGQLVPRELDITLFGEIFPNDDILDESAFREKLRAELGKEFDRAGDSRMNDEIYEMLVHTTPFELPENFLKRWLREGQEKPLSAAQVEHDFPGFQHQLRWTLVSDKLIHDNAISVSREEVINDMKGRVLAYFGMDNDEDAPWMDSYMEKMSKDEKTMNETYRQMLFGKLFEFLKTKFKISVKEVDEKEFLNLSSVHDAHHHHNH
ncbi:MAG: trigger factor [Chitinophagaceae bacterium]